MTYSNIITVEYLLFYIDLKETYSSLFFNRDSAITSECITRVSNVKFFISDFKDQSIKKASFRSIVIIKRAIKGLPLEEKYHANILYYF